MPSNSAATDNDAAAAAAGSPTQTYIDDVACPCCRGRARISQNVSHVEEIRDRPLPQDDVFDDNAIMDVGVVVQLEQEVADQLGRERADRAEKNKRKEPSHGDDSLASHSPSHSHKRPRLHSPPPPPLATVIPDTATNPNHGSKDGITLHLQRTNDILRHRLHKAYDENEYLVQEVNNLDAFFREAQDCHHKLDQQLFEVQHDIQVMKETLDNAREYSLHLEEELKDARRENEYLL